jgi:dihydrofolate reductase
VKPMLIYSMSVSVDGFIADREGGFEWTAPSEEMFGFHLAQVRQLGGYLCGRRLYETMLVWETDPSLRDNELRAAFADVWCAIPKVVFSRTLDSVQGNARLAEASVAEEAAAALDATDKDVGIGGAGLERSRSRRRYLLSSGRGGEARFVRQNPGDPRPRRGSPGSAVQSFVAADVSTHRTPLLPSWSAMTVSAGASLSSTTVPPAARAAATRCSATSGAT